MSCFTVILTLCADSGYVGGEAAAVSGPAAQQLTQLKFVQISYTSTNPKLSNKDLYPYFMRIISPDNVQATAMIEIVKGKFSIT